MAFPLRTNSDQDAALKSFMIKQGYKTKNGAIGWLIENAQRLIESDKKLNDINQAYERQLAAEKTISNLLAR